MSLVPVGDASNWSVVLQDSSRQALVLYNRQSGQVSLVSDPNLVYRRRRQLSHSTTCPNCGRSIVGDDEHNQNRTGGRPGTPPTDGLDRSFVIRDANYFQLLEYSDNRSPASSATNTRESTPRRRNSQYVEIADASFSQGYFDRFFVTKELLGRGSRGAVYLVEHVLDGVSLGMFALKKVAVGDDHAWLEKVLYEVKLLRRLSHRNLVKYNHVWLESSSLSSFGPTVPCAYILQEYCNGGTLEDYIFKGQPDRRDLPGQNSKRNLLRRKLQQASGQLNPPTRLSLEEITSFMTDVVSGVAHLHQSGVIHRDLKPSNCLLSLSDIEGERPCVLVSDFGEGQIEGNQRAGTGSTGTLEYCAPELLHIHDGQFSQFSKKTDMFSVGMILHFLCFSSLPYSDAWEAHGDLEALTNEVRAFPGFNFDRSNAKLARTDLPPQLLELLQNLLSLNPIERPSAEETLGVLAALSGGEGRPATEKVQEIRLVEEPSEASESDTRAGQPDPNLIMDRWYQSRESKQPPMYISYTKSLSLPRQRLFWIKAAFLALKLALLSRVHHPVILQVLTFLIGIEIPLLQLSYTTILFGLFCAIYAGQECGYKVVANANIRIRNYVISLFRLCKLVCLHLHYAETAYYLTLNDGYDDECKPEDEISQPDPRSSRKTLMDW